MTIEIRKPLKKILPHLIQAKESSLNEADTVQRLRKVFEDVLGYDSMTDISHESQMKGKYIDVVLKVDGVIRVLVEAKAAGEKLRKAHIDQAEMYGAQNTYKWVLLTNGTEWQLYHLTFSVEGIESQLAFSFDLSVPTEMARAEEHLMMLHKTSVKKGALEDFWKKATALNAASVGKALFNETVLAVIKREIRRKHDLLVDQEDLVKAIHDMLTPDAREMIGPPKVIKSARSAAASKPKMQQVQGQVPTTVESMPIASQDAVSPTDIPAATLRLSVVS